MTARASSVDKVITVSGGVCVSHRPTDDEVPASVNLVYDTKPGHRFYQSTGIGRRQQTSGESEAEVTNMIALDVTALLKLTADRHEALRGLSATVGLLVENVLMLFTTNYQN